MTSPFMQHKPKPGHNWIPLHQEYNNIVRAVCKGSPGVRCLDMVEQLRHRPELWMEEDGKKDPVHFNKEGGKIVGEALAEIIAPVLKAMAPDAPAPGATRRDGDPDG